MRVKSGLNLAIAVVSLRKSEQIAKIVTLGLLTGNKSLCEHTLNTNGLRLTQQEYGAMMTTSNSIMGETAAVTATAIRDCGRRIGYRGYLIHGEIPAISYAIYGRNGLGQLAELGNARSFAEAMRWVDRHRDGMRHTLAADAFAEPVLPDDDDLDQPAMPAVELRQAA